MLDAGNALLDAGNALLDAGNALLDAGNALLDAGRPLTSCQQGRGDTIGVTNPKLAPTKGRRGFAIVLARYSTGTEEVSNRGVRWLPPGDGYGRGE